jgi:hypothetical protein
MPAEAMQISASGTTKTTIVTRDNIQRRSGVVISRLLRAGNESRWE